MALPTTTTTRLGSPGDIVVPFSEIAALLQSRLSGLELNNLLTQLLGSRTSLVQPGDLITAEWATDVLNRIAALERGDVGGIGSPLSAQAIETLFESYEAYSSLASRGSFLPDGTGSAAFTGALGITTAIQNVLILAAASTGPAETTSADGLVDIFSRLYTVQKDLTVLFLSSIPEVSDPQPRLLFAQRVAAVLDNDAVGGALSLKNAVDQKQAQAAILAQDRINGIVTSETGKGIVGGIDVQGRGTTRGNTLVIGDAQPFGFIFRVTNMSNQQLAIQLTTEFAAPRQSWSGSTTIVGGANQILTLVPFDSTRPDNPQAFRDITVNVVTPAGAADGETGELRLRALAPAPIGVAGVGSAVAKVGTVQSNPSPSQLVFDTNSPVTISGDPANVSGNSSAELRFNLNFTTTAAQTTRSFRMIIETTDSAAAMQKFFIAIEDADALIDTAASTATKLQSKQFPMSDAQRRSVTVLCGVNGAASGDQLHLKVTVQAVDDATINDTRNVTLTAQ